MQMLTIVLLLSAIAAQGRVAIHAGRLLDVRTGNSQDNVYILVEGEKTTAIQTSAPAGIKLIDLSKLTVLPGLCDCHSHVLGDPKDCRAAYVIRAEGGLGCTQLTRVD
jgi:imidazolonepropionase-like amidohydrolase